MPTCKHGDLCSIPLGPRRHVAARVLLDVGEQCIGPGLISTGSPLAAYDGALLMEVYRDVSPEPSFHRSDLLIPGIFVDACSLQRGRWAIGGYAPVEPGCVDFPETLMDFSGKARFQKGEIDLPLPLEGSDIDHYRIYPTLTPSSALSDICLHLLDADGQIPHEFAGAMHLKNSDLRFSESRNGIYQLIGLDAETPYFRIAETFGFDIQRFYR